MRSQRLTAVNLGAATVTGLKPVTLRALDAHEEGMVTEPPRHTLAGSNLLADGLLTLWLAEA